MGLDALELLWRRRRRLPSEEVAVAATAAAAAVVVVCGTEAEIVSYLGSPDGDGRGDVTSAAECVAAVGRIGTGSLESGAAEEGVCEG